MKINSLKGITNNYNIIKNHSVKLNKNLGRDEISLSDNAKFFINAVKAAKNAEDVSVNKVNELKKKITTGTYELHGREVAQRIIEQAGFDKSI